MSLYAVLCYNGEHAGVHDFIGGNEMARSENMRLKLLFLSKILREQTDEDHPITMPEIIDELGKYDIGANRKSLYEDLEALRQYGLDVIKDRRGPQTYYYLGNREFQLAELKFLVDAIESSQFITERKAKDLIEKLSHTASVYDAKLLERGVKIPGRVRSMNESIYYTLDTIHTAMNNGKQIKFHYFRWNVKGEEEFRKDGEFYEVSPWMLVLDDEKYYLVAYDISEKIFKHYRVDKMRDVEESVKKRNGVMEFKKLNKAKYTQQYFRMFGGELETVTLRCKNELSNVIVDQFGKDVTMIPKDDEHFMVKVEVALSDQFFGWVISLGDGVMIEGPKKSVKRMKELGERVARMYT